MNQQQMMRLRKMQKQMMEAQEKLQNTVYTGTAGGVVKVEVKGTHEVLSVTIDPEAMKEDIEMVQDMIILAINDANKKIEDDANSSLGAFGNMGGFF